jgi:outer membrane biogenesis lipoprotein LolB
MIKPMLLLALTTALLTACVSPDNVRAAPDDTWTWQVNQNYQRFAHCFTDTLNSAPVQSWFHQAPRPITSFDQQWQRHRIILASIDPWGIQQVRIEVQGIDEHDTRIVASAKNLQALGGGAPMVYVRAYVDICTRA